MNRLFFLLLFLILNHNIVSSFDSNPKVTNGVIDCSNFDFTNKTLELKGDWEFYYNKLFSPEELNEIKENERSYLKVPTTLKDLNERYGFATYRLSIKLRPDNSIYSIKFPRIQTTYKIWIDNKLIKSFGEVETEKNDYYYINPKEVIYFS
ncbi:MAG TPA: hypothetical protein PK771_10005, partial [Spirochaetota bacterium]|nr:hypothetical protein [Spirochaetota bacterium]